MSSEWTWKRLGDHCSKIGSGSTPRGGKDSYLDSGPFTLIRSQNIYNEGFSSGGLAFISDEQAKKLDGVAIENKDILLNITGDSVARVCLAPAKYLPARVNQHVAIIRPQAATFDSRFVRYFLASPIQQDFMLGLASAGATRNALTKVMIEDFKAPCPPLHIQSGIADVLSALDDRIALLRASNATLEAIAQAMFKSWFVDFDPVHAKQQGRAPEGMSEATAALFSDSFEESELGLVPRGWSIGSIGKIAEVIDCLHAKKPVLLTSGRPYLQLNNIRDDGLLDTSNLAFISDADYAKWISRIEVSGGDCVITNVGRVGAVAQIPESFHAAMGRNMTAIRMRKEWPYPTYLVELLQSPWMEAEIQRRTDIGTILNALNVRNIPLLRCVLAGHNILTAFEDTARPLRAVMEANLDRANTLATLRDTLLPRLISGQLRLPNDESELLEKHHE